MTPSSVASLLSLAALASEMRMVQPSVSSSCNCQRIIELQLKVLQPESLEWNASPPGNQWYRALRKPIRQDD
jgi:hypothetical protein